MTKQGNTQSRGFVRDGAEITIEQGLEDCLEPLLLVLEEPVGEMLTDAIDAIGQVLSSGSMDKKQVKKLARAEEVLDRLKRAMDEVGPLLLGGDG